MVIPCNLKPALIAHESFKEASADLWRPWCIPLWTWCYLTRPSPASADQLLLIPEGCPGTSEASVEILSSKPTHYLHSWWHPIPNFWWWLWCKILLNQQGSYLQNLQVRFRRWIRHSCDRCLYTKVGDSNSSKQLGTEACELMCISNDNILSVFANSCAPTTVHVRLKGILCIKTWTRTGAAWLTEDPLQGMATMLLKTHLISPITFYLTQIFIIFLTKSSRNIELH